MNAPAPALAALDLPWDATRDAEFFEYSRAANPIRPSLTPRLPYHVFPASLHADGPTRAVPLDLSAELRCDGPATAPGLLASFVRIRAGESIGLDPNATSQVFYVIRGMGGSTIGESTLAWHAGDFFALPGGAPAVHRALTDSTLYWVNDAPLLAYLGVKPAWPRFAPTLYQAERADAELARAAGDPTAAGRSRVSVLLANKRFARTRTVTHTLWAMYGALPAGSTQKPHRHQSVALDLIVDCAPGCYTLVGPELAADGSILSPARVDWEPGQVFVTPPGYWHAHFNESGQDARLIPIQDAGLHTYLRSLDIRFT
jgi:gentisate 1,2-dioxygenase